MNHAANVMPTSATSTRAERRTTFVTFQATTRRPRRFRGDIRRIPSADVTTIDDDAEAYIDAIAEADRPLFDRVHAQIVRAVPDVAVSISYKILCYRNGRFRLYVGTWKHGVSLYGWQEDRDGGFARRHPELLSGRGTIRIRSRDAAAVTDDELRDLAAGALQDAGDVAPPHRG